MTSLRAAIAKGEKLDVLRPWSRIAVDAGVWTRAAREISKGEGDLLGLWSDGDAVHMALRANDDPTPVVFSLTAVDGHFISVGRMHAPAQRLERAIHDLHGLVPEGAPDERPWLDHGVWGVTHPAGDARRSDVPPAPYAFLQAGGAPLHQIPVGPVHAGIIEPGHFRFSANGETVVRLEERLGYTHKGTETLMRGAEPAQAGKLAGRISGDSTVAYAWAFASAVEAALELTPPPRAIALRAVMAEIERIANHLGDIGAICNDAAFALLQAHCAILRERALRAAKACFGHRLMMDRIVPGGVACDLPASGAAQILAMLEDIDAVLPKLMQVYDSTASLQDRTVSTGKLAADLVQRFAAGGFVGRASGRAFDARRALPYAPYDALRFEAVVRSEGDVDARLRVRADEVIQSMSIIRQALKHLPDSSLIAELPTVEREREGIAVVEGFRGDILAWARLDAAGKISRCHLRDPSWFQWPLLEAAIEGNIVADFPLCNKSFNCSYSGHDL